jgi:PAS domain S-box-containing protein
MAGLSLPVLSIQPPLRPAQSRQAPAVVSLAGWVVVAVKSGQVPVRLLAEILAIVVLVEVGLVLGLPRLLPMPQGGHAALMNAALLALLTAPTLYWRCMQATRRAGLLAQARQFHVTASEPPAAALADTAQRRRRAAVVMTALTQGAGLALTAAAMHWTATGIEDEARQRFERHVERLQTEVQRRFNQPVYGLTGARGAYAASGRIDRESLAAYTSARDLPREFPGLLGFGFIERVERTQLDAFVQRTRAELGPAFQVRSSGEASDLYVIKYIEPLAGNMAAHGFDLGSDAIRREAIERAIDTGEATLTGQVSLVQMPNQNHGFLYVVPLYRQGADAQTGAQRRRMLIGLLYAPIYTDDLLADVAAVTDQTVDIELYDGDGMQRQQQVFDSAGHLARHGGAPGAAHYAHHLFSTARSLLVGGRLLTLRASTSAGFEAAVDRSAIVHIGLGGALLSCLLALAVWSLAAGRVRALSLAQRMTADLDRLAQVVRHTQNAVTITDRDLRITWINEGFTRITGYTLAEAAGKTPRELLDSGEADPEVLRRLATSAAAGRSCRVEILNRRKDGRTYWIDTEIQPMHDAHGQLSGFMEIGSDITDKREATARLQAALRENDSLLGVIQQHAIVASADPQGRITDANDAYCRISGYRRDELIGRHHLMVDTGLDTDEFHGVIAPLLQAGQPWRGELCNRAKDGSLYWVDTAIAPFFDASGRIERFITIRHDITARETAARELARERERLDNIVRGTHGGTWEWNVHTGETLINERWAEIIGHSVAELAPVTVDTFRDRVHPEDAARSAALVQRHFDGETDYYDCELRMRHRDGHWVWVHSRGRVSHRDGAGRPLWMAGTHMDISARKRAESEMQRAEALLRGAIDAVNEAFVLFDADDRLVFCNDKYREIYASAPDLIQAGNSFEHILRESVQRGLFTVAAEQLDDWLAERMAAHRQGITQVQRLADGRWLRLIERRMPDGHTVGFRIDITDLVNATEAAEAASQAKSRFLANTSHEIRTPMNAVLGMLRLLRNTDMTARQRDCADKAERAARTLLALLNDILDFSKVEAGKLELDCRPFEVTALMADLSVILSANLTDRPVALRFDIDPALPPRLVGDDLRLQQVLLNLAGNAIKFTERGEVVLRLALVRADATSALVEFSVSDTGIGIAPEHQQHIFDGFAQAEASTTRRFGGTGLGLSICQRLVALMGGRISLDSAPGRGSRFAFSLALPLADAAGGEAPALQHGQATGAAQMEPPGQRLAGLRVLVVEDNPINQEVARDLLQDEGAVVTLAGDGRQGVAAVIGADPGFDAVLMDVQMPVMDGHAAASHLRREPGLASLPIIAMTANAMPSDRAASLAAGMNDHIGKPFDLDELVAVLRRHVPARPAHRAPALRRRRAAASVLTPEVRGPAQAAGFDLDGALQRLAGRVDVYVRLAASFDTRLATLPADLAALLQPDRRAEAERLAHTIKGVAATLGALRLAAMAGEVEQALRQWPPQPPQADWQPRWEAAVEGARAALAELLPRLQASDAAVPAAQRAGRQTILGQMSVNPAATAQAAADGDATQSDALRRGLQTLAGLLAESDMAATDCFAEIALAPGCAGWRPLLEPLAAPMAALDFAAALAICRTILARLDQPAAKAHAPEGMAP